MCADALVRLKDAYRIQRRGEDLANGSLGRRGERRDVNFIGIRW